VGSKLKEENMSRITFRKFEKTKAVSMMAAIMQFKEGLHLEFLDIKGNKRKPPEGYEETYRKLVDPPEDWLEFWNLFECKQDINDVD
jgi:hypothetical protein